MRRVVCPGSFDPVTLGHLDIIERASSMYDEVVVAVLVNATKKGLFDVDERMDMIAAATVQCGNVRVDSFHGLLVDYCRDHDIPVIVKGLRVAGDFDYELQMAQMNRRLADIETTFLPTTPEHSYLSSSLVKEIARFGGDISAFVPTAVASRLIERLAAGGT